MLLFRLSVLVLIAALLDGSSVAAGDLKSGPQKISIQAGLHGRTVSSTGICFYPVHCSGKFAGRRQCPLCLIGNGPYVMIFARDTSGSLMKLVKKVDAATVANSKARMESFVVVCNDHDKTEEQLTTLANKEGLDKCLLTVHARKLPTGYELNPSADITVVLATGSKTQAQYAFRKGELKEKDIEAILSDLNKILPKKK